MKKLISLIAALALAGAVSPAFATTISSDGNRGAANQIRTAVFNDSGSTLTSGTVVIWDTGTDETDAQLGAYINTTTSADSNLVAGVTTSPSMLNQGVGTIVVYGPIQALFAASTDGGTKTAGTAVGTANGVAGQFGTGTGLGVIIAPAFTDSADSQNCFIFVNPSNAE